MDYLTFIRATAAAISHKVLNGEAHTLVSEVRTVMVQMPTRKRTRDGRPRPVHSRRIHRIRPVKTQIIEKPKPVPYLFKLKPVINPISISNQFDLLSDE